jgi:signal transduction histidine kinase
MMKSVYAKVLSWSIGVLILSLVVFLFISRAMVYNAFGNDGELRILIATQFAEGDRIYQAEGQKGLAAYLKVLNSSYPGDYYYILDLSNHDLITGENRSQLAAMANSWLSIFNLNFPPVFSVSSGDRPYKMVLISRWRGTLARYLPYYLILIFATALLCWILAFQFASPLKRLTETVRRFGAGDLAARAQLSRGDEIGDLARAFDQMANRIETLLTAERRLLQDISHELRSPLGRLILAAQLAETSANREGARNQIKKEVNRIVDLVESLLQVTRAEGDLSTRNLEGVALDSLILEMVEDCRIEADARGCDLQVKGSNHLKLQADRELLRRALENVVRNAIRHAPPGTSIEVSLSKTSGRASISVRDYGPGVPADDLTNIFKPFFRADSSRDASTGGVGLGLAIAERAIRVHNGQVWAENAEPGLRVWLDLPLEHATELQPVHS